MSERKYDDLRDIPQMKEGDHVVFRARVHHIRPLGSLCSPEDPGQAHSWLVTGSKIVFIVFRHQFTTVQGVLTEEPDKVSQTMVRWAEGIARESIVLVEGVIQRPPPNQENVHSTSIHEYEVKVAKVCNVVECRGVHLRIVYILAAFRDLLALYDVAISGGRRVEAKRIL